MPLKQTLLDFKSAFAAATSSAALSNITTSRPELIRSHSGISTASTGMETDTIVVDTSEEQEPRIQLPTPSESVSDQSSQTSEIRVPRSRVKRVNAKLGTPESFEQVEDPSHRTVSGDTLVDQGDSSMSARLKKRDLDHDQDVEAEESIDGSDIIVAAVDSEYVEQNSEEQHIEHKSNESEEEDDEEAEQQRREALRAKIEENARIRAQKYKEADEKATRRSARQTVFEKATSIVSDLTATVLGKRKDRTDEAPEPKKRCLDENEVSARVEPSQKKLTRRSKDKRWLASGLYAGQIRAFDGRLTESKNKRKAAQDCAPKRDSTVIPLPMFAGDRLLKLGRDFKLPFDVFSPLPAGQPKPDEWKKVNKNVFVGDAAQEWRISKFAEHSTCMCRSDSGCDHNCMNRYMYYECDERNCNLSEEQCGNRSFEGLKQRVKKGGKYNVGVEVIKTVDRGYGVRSNRTFEPNQIIVEYTGEIITQEECESRMRTIYKTNECYYLMLFDQNMIIDATRGSIARFVNHACEPNCRMEKWTVGGKPRMALFAGEGGIMTGEELTYDYNFDPYSQKNVQECRCGSAKCRGVLGPKQKSDKQKSPEEKERSGSKTQSKQSNSKKRVADGLGQTAKGKLVKKSSIVKTRPKPSLSASPAKVQHKAKLVKKALARTLGLSSTSTTEEIGLTRRPSKLRKVLEEVKAVKSGSEGSKKRITSTPSASQALIAKNSASSMARSAKLKAKTATFKRNVVRTVRGAKSGQGRSLRPVVDENDEESHDDLDEIGSEIIVEA